MRDSHALDYNNTAYILYSIYIYIASRSSGVCVWDENVAALCIAAPAAVAAAGEAALVVAQCAYSTFDYAAACVTMRAPRNVSIIAKRRCRLRRRRLSAARAARLASRKAQTRPLIYNSGSSCTHTRTLKHINEHIVQRMCAHVT